MGLQNVSPIPIHDLLPFLLNPARHWEHRGINLQVHARSSHSGFLSSGRFPAAGDLSPPAAELQRLLDALPGAGFGAFSAAPAAGDLSPPAAELQRLLAALPGAGFGAFSAAFLCVSAAPRCVRSNA
jgi:hypothetical protein